MIRTRDEIVAERNKALKSIELLNAEQCDLSNTARSSEDKEFKIEIYKKLNAVRYRIIRLKGIVESLDFIINYDSNINTEPYYISSMIRYNVK